jgi:outer membrane immunogenic protein
MFRVSTSVAILLASTSAAFAGPADVPPPPPPVIVPIEEPFEGFYIGLEYGHGSGTADQDVIGANFTEFDYDGDAYGIFAGYNIQNGALVYGGEVRYLELTFEDSMSGASVDNVLDLRARVGFAPSEQVLLYAAAGYSMADASLFGSSFDMTGFNYGAGLEYNISDSFFVGADYTGRELEGTNGGATFEGSVNTATLRVGFRF